MDDHKIEEAKDKEEKASKDSISARKALKAKKKEKARSDLAFDKGNLLKGIDKIVRKLRFRSFPLCLHTYVLFSLTNFL